MDDLSQPYLFCLILAGLAVPLVLRWIPPNPLYGVRTPTTVRDQGIWYDANAFGGRMLLIAAAVGALLIRLGVRSAFALLGPLLVGLVASLLYVRRLRHERAP